MPFAIVPFLLLAIPVLEIGVFIAVGQQIGIGYTLLGILLTAIIGTFLLRRQGFALIGRIRAEVDAGRVPARALADGAMLVVAGILLLTPGFVTDAIGFALFVPALRRAIFSGVASKVAVVAMSKTGMSARGGSRSSRADPRSQAPGSGPVVDLDAEEFTSRPAEDPESSPWRDPADRSNP